MATLSVTLSVDRCPHDVYEVVLSCSRPKRTGGTRLTPSRCCGHADQVMTWIMTASALREMAEELESYAEIAQEEELAHDD